MRCQDGTFTSCEKKSFRDYDGFKSVVSKYHLDPDETFEEATAHPLRLAPSGYSVYAGDTDISKRKDKAKVPSPSTSPKLAVLAALQEILDMGFIVTLEAAKYRSAFIDD